MKELKLNLLNNKDAENIVIPTTVETKWAELITVLASIIKTHSIEKSKRN